MDAKQPQLPPLGENAVAGMPGSSVASWSVLGAEDTLAALRAELDRAREELRLGDYTKALAGLERLFARLERVEQDGTTPRTDRADSAAPDSAQSPCLARRRGRF